MAVYYKLRQDNRKNSTKRGQWYARAVTVGTYDTDAIAKEVQSNCSMKRSDVLAVLAEMRDVMTRALQEGYRVRLDGIGTFKIGLRTRPALTAKEFSAANNVSGMRVNFQPETHVLKDKTRVQELTNGAEVRELPKNAVGTSEEGDDAE